MHGSYHRLGPKCRGCLVNIGCPSCCALVTCYQTPIPVMLEASLLSELRAMLSIAFTRHHTSHPQGILLTKRLRVMVTTSAAHWQG